MIRTFKYPLRPTVRQRAILESWLTLCRQLYNCALEQRRECWRMAIPKNISYNYQTKELTEIRAADPVYGHLPVEAARSSLRALQHAFDGFFRRVREGDTPGYPRFKGKDRFSSFGIGRVKVEGKKVRVPNLGLVKFHLYRPIEGEIRDVRLCRQADRWFVCFSCDVGEAPAKVPVSKSAGVDLGLNSFAVLSDGKRVENPRFFRKSEDLLARRQRALSTKKRGSKSRFRAKILVQKAYAHVRNQRVDFARKLAAELFKTYDLIAYEDLNIQGLAKSRLSKSINDAAWGGFIRALVSKAECAGKWAVPVNPRGTSIRCSRCGDEVLKTLSERVHRCACGLTLDRDENAARNILALGRSAADVRGQSPLEDATRIR